MNIKTMVSRGKGVGDKALGLHTFNKKAVFPVGISETTRLLTAETIAIITKYYRTNLAFDYISILLFTLFFYHEQLSAFFLNFSVYFL